MKRIVWYYSENHAQHPFIVIAARSLAQAGYDVTIVNSHPAAANEPYRTLIAYPERIKRIAKKKPGAAVASPKQPNPPSSRLSWRDFASAHLPKRAWRKIQREWPSYKKRLLIWRDAKKKRYRQLRYFYKDILWDSFRKAFPLPADIIIGTRPESAMVGWITSKLKRARFVYFTFEMMRDRKGKPSALLIFFENLIFRYADAVITQNECRAKVYVEEYGCRKPPAIIHNYKPRREVKKAGALRQLLGLSEDKRIVLYEGMLMEGRWLDKVVEASLLFDERTILVMMGEDRLGWADDYNDLIAEATKRGKLIITDAVPHDQLLSYVADADAGIIIYDDSCRNNYFCEPGKLNDYIAAGVPVVAPAFPSIKPVLDQYAIGECFNGNSPQAICETIHKVLSRSKEQWQPALQEAAGALTWESQLPVLLSVISGDKK